MPLCGAWGDASEPHPRRGEASDRRCAGRDELASGTRPFRRSLRRAEELGRCGSSRRRLRHGPSESRPVVSGTLSYALAQADRSSPLHSPTRPRSFSGSRRPRGTHSSEALAGMDVTFSATRPADGRSVDGPTHSVAGGSGGSRAAYGRAVRPGRRSPGRRRSSQIRTTHRPGYSC